MPAEMAGTIDTLTGPGKGLLAADEREETALPPQETYVRG